MNNSYTPIKRPKYKVTGIDVNNADGSKGSLTERESIAVANFVDTEIRAVEAIMYVRYTSGRMYDSLVRRLGFNPQSYYCIDKGYHVVQLTEMQFCQYNDTHKVKLKRAKDPGELIKTVNFI